MSQPGITEVDPWLDDRFAPLDNRQGSLMDRLEGIAAEDPAFTPHPEPSDDPEEIIDPGAPPARGEAPPAQPAAPAPAAVQPERIENADGTSIEIAQTSKGWKATIDSGTGAQPEVFYGNTKDEMWANIARGKANATKQIRELTRQMKLGTAPAQVKPAVPAQVSGAVGRDLTAEEAFEIKTMFDSNPDQALTKWWQIKTGKGVNEVATNSEEGRIARLELESEAASKEFMEKTPDYFVSPDNFRAIVSWLSRNKLGVIADANNFNNLYSGLVIGGHWTVKNLTEAFLDLAESGLLEVEQAQEEPEQVVPTLAPQPQPTATPAPANARIGRTVRQPRAGLGTRPSATARVPESADSPAVEDLDNLSDKDIKSLWEGVRRQKLAGRR